MSRKNIYVLPDPCADKIQYWKIDDNLFTHLHPVVKLFYYLTQQTCPHPNEHIIYKAWMDHYNCSQDSEKNYYRWVLNPDGSKPETMFTSHLDTADRDVCLVKHRCFSKIPYKSTEERYYFETDGNSILGADCKAGTALQLWMIEQKIPGLYYFFLGEEVGLIGARAISQKWKSIEEFSGIKRCVSLDRRALTSIISRQGGTVCCSPEFVEALSSEFRKANLTMVDDPGGIATDSLAFVEIIPECTNLSVGYYYAHSKSETQDVTFLGELAEAIVKVNWESLPTVRTPEPKFKSLTTKHSQTPTCIDAWDDFDFYTPTAKTGKETGYDKFLSSIKNRIPYVIEFREIKTVIANNPLEFMQLVMNSIEITEEKLIDKMIAHLYPSKTGV